MKPLEGSIQEAINKLKQSAEAPEPELNSEPEEVFEDTEEESVEEAVAPPEESEESEETAPDVTEAETEAESIELEAEQFAELLNLKPDLINIDDDGIKFRAKVGDKTEDVTLERLLNAFQGDANLTNRSKELAEIRKAQESSLIELQNQTQQFAQQSASLLEGLKEQFLKPFDDINWKELKEEDPGQYAALMADKRSTEETLSGIAQQTLASIKESQKTQNQELQRQYSEYLFQQESMLTDTKSALHIPNLEKVYPEIKSYMGSIGFQEQEQNQLTDARLLNAFYKSMLFDKGKAGVQTKLKRPLPKVLKPGKTPSKDEVSASAKQKLKSKLKESGDWRDAVALLKSRRS